LSLGHEGATPPIVPSEASAPTAPADRVLTIPNLISVLRLLGVPLFLWLLLGPKADAWALVVLMLSGISDWADGVLARKLNQMSSLGALLDPAADRLYILATLVGLVLRGILPWPIAALIIARDLVLAPTIPLLRRHGYGPLPVHYLGKAATFNLLYAFPLLLIATGDNPVARLAAPFAWAFTLWGTALYLWAGALYLIQTAQLVRAAPTGRGPGRAHLADAP
jgi:cardiolipin synthase